MHLTHCISAVLLTIHGYHDQITLNQLQGVIMGEWLDSEVQTVSVYPSMHLDMI